MFRFASITTLTLTTLAGLLPLPGQAAVTEECKALFAGQRITLIVPNAPGGGYDTYGRALAPELETASGATVNVINMPAGGGMVALSTLVASGPDEMTIMVENASDIVRAEAIDGVERGADLIQTIGVFYSEPSAWVSKADLALTKDLVNRPLVGAASSAEVDTEYNLVAAALGLKIETVSGYDGSKDTEAAVLRGEADFTSNSLSTSLKSAKSGDLAVVLLLSDTPSPEAPGVPHLAGEDGLAAEWAKDATAEEKARVMQYAKLVSIMSFNVRSVLAPMAMRTDVRDCMIAAVDESIQSPEFKATAEAQGRPVQSMPLDEAKVRLAAQSAGVEETRRLLSELGGASE